MGLYLVLFALILSFTAQSFVKSNYNKYRQIGTHGNLRGVDVAQRILDANNIHDISIVQSNSGVLSDHFDPANKRIALSPDIYNGTSIASVAVAAHEVGHAIQYNTGYVGISLRNKLLKPTLIANQFSGIFIMMGILFFDSTMGWMFDVGIVMLAVVLAFQVLTLPVEFDASARALKNLSSLQLVDSTEHSGAKKMLTAAALTYVAAVVGSLANLLRFIMIRNSRRNR